MTMRAMGRLISQYSNASTGHTTILPFLGSRNDGLLSMLEYLSRSAGSIFVNLHPLETTLVMICAYFRLAFRKTSTAISYRYPYQLWYDTYRIIYNRGLQDKNYNKPNGMPLLFKLATFPERYRNNSPIADESGSRSLLSEPFDMKHATAARGE